MVFAGLKKKAERAGKAECSQNLRVHRGIFGALLRKWNVTTGDWRHHIMSWQETHSQAKVTTRTVKGFSSHFLALVLRSTAHA